MEICIETTANAIRQLAELMATGEVNENTGQWAMSILTKELERIQK